MGTFATTHWNVIFAAGQSGRTEAEAALADLCEAYWYPIHSCVRRHGYGPADAEDLNQGFFLHLLEDNSVARADRKKRPLQILPFGGLEALPGGRSRPGPGPEARWRLSPRSNRRYPPGVLRTVHN